MRLKTVTTLYKTPVLLILPLLLLTSCSREEDEKDCERIEKEYVVTVNAPETAELNETVNIEVEFNVDNSCGEFNQFIDTGSGTTRTIEVEAVYKGCGCYLAIMPVTATYSFIPEEAGAYELNFQSGAEEFITVEILVM